MSVCVRAQLHSHPKQRKLFQELFAKCTAVIVSAGNETVWEAVSRGVPVLTVPTEGHGEQLLNAAVHARNFPHLVRARPHLDVVDVEWLVHYNLEAAVCAPRLSNPRLAASSPTMIILPSRPTVDRPPSRRAMTCDGW